MAQTLFVRRVLALAALLVGIAAAALGPPARAEEQAAARGTVTAEKQGSILTLTLRGFDGGPQRVIIVGIDGRTGEQVFRDEFVTTFPARTSAETVSLVKRYQLPADRDVKGYATVSRPDVPVPAEVKGVTYERPDDPAPVHLPDRRWLVPAGLFALAGTAFLVPRLLRP